VDSYGINVKNIEIREDFFCQLQYLLLFDY